MKFIDSEKTTKSIHELEEHLNMVHAILMAYMFNNDIDEIIAVAPKSKNDLVSLTLQFSNRRIDDGSIALVVTLIKADE